MKKRLLSLLLSALLLANLTACNTVPEKEIESTIEDINTTITTIDEHKETKPPENEKSSFDTNSTTEILNDILQKQYKWKDFAVIYPQYEITAQSPIAMNITVPEFENVVFVFSGSLEDDISEYKMASANAAGDVLLPEHFGKTFDQIIAEETGCVSYTLSDEIMQHLYKYEDVYIYRSDFYYFIRGFRHSNTLTKEHIAMFRYDENHKRPW